jgi:hypothetical protein
MAITLIDKCFSSFLCLFPTDSFGAKHLVLLETKAPTPFQQRNTDFDVVLVCAAAIQIVRPWESTVETQRQLQPALLRLSTDDVILTLY